MIRRPAPTVVVVAIEGADVGELGDRPFHELAKNLDGSGTIQLFIDARAASAASVDVSGRWATWLNEHRMHFEHVTMLTGSRFVRITAGIVRDFSGLGERVRIHTDAAAFDEALRAATTSSSPAQGERAFPNWEDLIETTRWRSSRGAGGMLS